MRATARRIWRDHPLLVLGFALALGVTLVLALRLVWLAPDWRTNPANMGPVAGWMTPRFVAHAYAIPPEALAKALGIAPGTGPRTLADIAAGAGVPLADLLARVDALRPRRADP